MSDTGGVKEAGKQFISKAYQASKDALENSPTPVKLAVGAGMAGAGYFGAKKLAKAARKAKNAVETFKSTS